MTEICPGCGSRPAQSRMRLRHTEGMPEIASVRWDCGGCGWSSDPTSSTDSGLTPAT
jgi:hypothetical protein